MSRAGEEKVLELSRLLSTDTVKTAAKKEKDEDKKEEKKEKCKECDKEECECEKKDKKDEKKDEKKQDKNDEKKEDKKKSKKKKAEIMLGVVNDLVKLANELDTAGADDAANLVDEALQIIMKNIDKE
jgi:hypothetical protein